MKTMIAVCGIDPGLRECGWALCNVQTSAIVGAGLARNPEKESKGIAAWERMALEVRNEIEAKVDELDIGGIALLVVERQWIASHARGKREAEGEARPVFTANPSQILTLAHVVGAICLAVPAGRKLAILPSQWKGGSTKGRANKKKHNRELWAGLGAGEREVVVGAETWLGHNVKDSIGIAKWAAGRYGFLVATHFAGLD